MSDVEVVVNGTFIDVQAIGPSMVDVSTHATTMLDVSTPGIQGVPGPAGDPGTSGTVILTGEGAPTEEEGLRVGDMYLDTVSGNLYQWQDVG